MARRCQSLNDVKAHAGGAQVQGFLTGWCYTIFFCAMLVPLGRLADKRSPHAVLIAGLAMWSVCTVATGFARDSTQLIVARIFVAVGEATCAVHFRTTQGLCPPNHG